MIARIWRGVVRQADADRYLDYLHRTGIPDYQATPGNLGVSILQRDIELGVEFTTLTFWDSMESIKAFAGDTPEVARYYPEDDEFLLFREPLVEHFDVPYTNLPIGTRGD
jgi:heme-degrading monooxygenase HmoA